MNENTSEMMYQTEPAVAALNKVPNFDPLKYLRRTKDALKLDLPAQKLWFRMAHPNGPMQLKALRITEQMAIFEARVFLDRSDAAPISVSVVQRTSQDCKDYIKAAQDDALSQALSDAGFGIQFADVGLPREQRPAPPAVGAKHNTAQKNVRTAVTPAPTPEQSNSEVPPVQHKTPEAQEKPMHAAGSRDTIDEKPEQLPAVDGEPPVGTAQKEQPGQFDVLPAEALPVSQRESTIRLVGMDTAMNRRQSGSAGAENAPQPVQNASQALDKEAALPAGPAYTPDMPVEEILKMMTYEEALAVVVDEGACKGETIAQVAKRRAVSLRFYLTAGNRSKNNIVRAAAKIVLDAMAEQKAS